MEGPTNHQGTSPIPAGRERGAAPPTPEPVADTRRHGPGGWLWLHRYDAAHTGELERYWRDDLGGGCSWWHDREATRYLSEQAKADGVTDEVSTYTWQAWRHRQGWIRRRRRAAAPPPGQPIYFVNTCPHCQQRLGVVLCPDVDSARQLLDVLVTPAKG